MGLFIKQDEGRSELQQKIAADIAERQRARANDEATPPDGVNDSRMIEGTSRMSRTGVILLSILVVIIVAILLFVSTR